MFVLRSDLALIQFHWCVGVCVCVRLSVCAESAGTESSVVPGTKPEVRSCGRTSSDKTRVCLLHRGVGLVGQLFAVAAMIVYRGLGHDDCRICGVSCRDS